MTSSALTKAINLTGNVSLLAKAVGVSCTAAQKWERKGFIPPTSILRVEKALKGRVTRYELIDDFFSKQGANLETQHGTEAPAAGSGNTAEIATLEGGITTQGCTPQPIEH